MNGATSRERTSRVVKIAISLQLGLLMWQFSPELSTNGDNAAYYVLGKALGAGKGYRNIHLVDAPPEAKYPFGTPLLIALTQIFARSPLPAQLLMGLLGACCTILCYYLFRSTLSPPLLIPFLVMVAFSGLLAEYHLVLMSETPYILATLAALLLRDHVYRNPARGLMFFSAVVVSIVPIHFRSIGIVFSAAWMLDDLLSRHYRSAFIHLGLLVLTVVVYRSFSSTQSEYVNVLLLKDSYDPEMGTVTAGGMVARIIGNLKVHIAVLFPKSFLPFMQPSVMVLRRAVVWPLLLLACIGWFRSFAGKHRIIALYVLFYVGIMLVWPVSIPRRIACILPFVFFFIVFGMDVVLHALIPLQKGTLRKCRRAIGAHKSLIDLPSQKRAVVLVTTVLVGFNLHYRLTHPHRAARLTRDWANFYYCAHWVRRNTPKNAIVMNRKPGLFYLRARRRGCLYPYSHDVDKVIKSMEDNGVTHVVLDNFPWTRTTAKYLYPAIMSYPDRFDVVYALENPDTFVLRFKGKR